jgi:hypothetical protein
MKVFVEEEYRYDFKATMSQRRREVRDLYKKLTRVYRTHKVFAFFDREFHIGPAGINAIICEVDDLPIDKKRCSTIYKIAMKPDYRL